MVPRRSPAATDQWQKTPSPVYLNCCTDVLLLYKNDVKNASDILRKRGDIQLIRKGGVIYY